jgi:hypothetical protein
MELLIFRQSGIILDTKTLEALFYVKTGKEQEDKLEKPKNVSILELQRANNIGEVFLRQFESMTDRFTNKKRHFAGQVPVHICRHQKGHSKLRRKDSNSGHLSFACSLVPHI